MFRFVMFLFLLLFLLLIFLNMSLFSLWIQKKQRFIITFFFSPKKKKKKFLFYLSCHITQFWSQPIVPVSSICICKGRDVLNSTPPQPH